MCLFPFIILLRDFGSEVPKKVLLVGGLLFWGERIMTVAGISVYRGKAAIFRIVESTMAHRDFAWLFLGNLDERVLLPRGCPSWIFHDRHRGILRLGAPRQSEAATANQPLDGARRLQITQTECGQFLLDMASLQELRTVALAQDSCAHTPISASSSHGCAADDRRSPPANAACELQD